MKPVGSLRFQSSLDPVILLFRFFFLSTGCSLVLKYLKNGTDGY
jgi:hypothetical protein